ncbi:MAG: Rossmann-like and DUF2520 domain-containing protein [Pyrinomonadaceae bacterium]
MAESVSIIGVGRLGGALALALSRKDYAVKQLVAHQKNISKIAGLISPAPQILASGEFGKIDSEIIFITTPDAEIRMIAEKLTNTLKHKPFVFHTSGALSSEVLQSLKNIGCPTGSIHPLVSVSDSVNGAENFKNVFFCVEGLSSAVALAEKIVARLEGKSFSIPTEFKTLYHASAVMASGHLVALFSVAVEMLAACGLSETEAQKILFPLLSSTIKNLSAQTPAKALTGTFARGDAETLRRHLETLRENASAQTLEIYRQLGLRSLHLAERQGANAEKLAEMMNLMVNGE